MYPSWPDPTIAELTETWNGDSRVQEAMQAIKDLRDIQRACLVLGGNERTYVAVGEMIECFRKPTPPFTLDNLLYNALRYRARRSAGLETFGE